jgi:5-methylcytosine-specific restriction endonuclease McrA
MEMAPRRAAPRPQFRRESLPQRVRHDVWRRDKGCCVDCGSRERLEYDHIIPVSSGGSNTTRNIELRCESCNRTKGASV